MAHSLASFREKITASPILIRTAPFLFFVTLTFAQGQFGEAGRYWIYFGKSVVGAWLLWQMRPFVAEMKWNFSWEAVAVGLFVGIFWVALDPFYPRMGQSGTPWNPLLEFASNPALAWFFVIARILGSSLVVPPLEEIFYRSFLYRWIAKPEFTTVALNFFHWKPLLVTALFFGLAHHEWLAGILCGLCYQWLVLRKNRLGDAITAHAITNFLLGLWIVWKGAWQFW